MGNFLDSTMADRQKQIELEEARKADGKEINPHIPQLMLAAPWYLANAETPSLKHQRKLMLGPVRNTKSWYERGAKTFQAVKFRKEDCEK